MEVEPCYLTDKELRFYKVKRVLEMDDDDGSTTSRVYFKPLKDTLKMVKMVSFMYVYITTIKKKL